MNIIHVSESVVILGKDHNPSILHPSFLVAQHIVPADWAQADPPICTPPFSAVKYTNGITFIVQPDKLQIARFGRWTEKSDSNVPDFALKYIRTLPYVPYTAVGVNFGVIFLHPSPSQYLVERFLKPGPWNEGDLSVAALSLELSYRTEGGTLALSCGQQVVAGSLSIKPDIGISVNANFHYYLSEDEPLKEAEGIIEKFHTLREDFIQSAERIFSL